MPSSNTYKDLIDGCKANSRQHQEKLYRLFFDKMLSMCRKYTQDEDQLISIINDGFIKVFTKIDQFDHKGSFEGWVRRLIFSSLSDFFRKENKYIKFMIFEPPEGTVQAEPEQSLYYQDVVDLLDLLPLKTQQVFHKYAIEGCKHRDIAAELGMSIGTSKWHLSDARKKLQKILSERNIYNSNVR